MDKVPITLALLILTFYTWAGKKPPLSIARVGGELLAGAIGGLAGFALPMLVFSTGEGEDWGGMVALFCVVPVTYPLITAAGVYLVGRIGDETGSLLATLGGSYLGEIAGYLSALAVSKIGLLKAGSFNEIWFFAAGPPIGAIIGFNLFRKYK